MDLVGNYTLNVKFGGITVPLSHQMVRELTIAQDIDRFLPTFKLVVKDATGLLGEYIPFDRNLNKVSIEIARGTSQDNLNEFEFTVSRRRTNSERDYVIQGILDVNNLVETRKTRALTGNVRSNLETIAKDELGIDEQNIDIGLSLDYDKTLLQPAWTNAKFFNYIKRNLLGRNSEAGYYCFIKNIQGKRILVFKSIDELFSIKAKYNLLVSHKQHEDFYPVLDYKVYDDSQLVANFGAKYQTYEYFDYATGVNKTARITTDEYPSLTEQYLIDDDRNTDSVIFSDLGRSNDFTSDFKGRVKNNFYRRMTEPIHMWAATWGLESISPGDIVNVLFGEAFLGGDLSMYQHSGFWMVKRVVHIVSSSFLTNLLLTRSGVDTDTDTTLMNAQNYKKT